MYKLTAALAIVATSCLTVSCSDSEPQTTAAGPSALLLKNSTSFARVEPSNVTAQLVAGGNCPLVQPLHARFALTVLADDDATLFVNEVRMQFIDAAGVAAPQVTLPAPQATTQFGTALVQARSSLTFPLDLAFGCGTGRTGTIVVIVHGRDGRGFERSTDVRIGVR
jgi:hypothetical protein